MVRRREKKLFVEGGGDNDALKTECRRGFREFLQKAGLKGRMPRIIACGARSQAYRQFRVAVREAAADDVFLLLVDSEGPIAADAANARPWDHVENHTEDGWSKPSGATDDDLHFMVECMENWFLGDPQALGTFFGPGFRPSALPANRQVENVPKGAVLKSLRNATSASGKGEYGKGRHSFKLLAEIDPNKVRAVAPYADRLLSHLDTVL